MSGDGKIEDKLSLFSEWFDLDSTMDEYKIPRNSEKTDGN